MKHLVIALLMGLTASVALAQPLKDVPGSSDFEGLPRVANTKIVGYQFSEYDAAPFVVGKGEKRLAQLVEPEGARYRFIYAGVPSQSPLQLIRNYQKAFEQFGDYQLHYECSASLDCPKMIAANVIWRDGNRMSLDVPGAGIFRASYPSHEQPRYFYATVVREGERLHVSGFSVRVQIGGEVNAEIPFLHLEILREEAFSDDLAFVSSSEMQQQIEASGAVALYGLTFEFDSAALDAASAQTVAEIAALLRAEPSLQVYVVGHTDNQGALAYNETLSGRRAASVVAALVSTHGIAAGRLESRGVGPLAPVASNTTAAGQALNRRVEIVKR